MNKKLVLIIAIIIAILLGGGVAFWFLSHAQPSKPKATHSAVPVATAKLVDTKVGKTVQVPHLYSVETFFRGVGSGLSSAQKQAYPKADSKAKVVMLTYKVTNISSKTQDFSGFVANVGWFKDSGNPAAWSDTSALSLHNSLKVPSYPYPANKLNSKSANGKVGTLIKLKPGQSAEWSIDWFVDSTVQDKNVTLIQTFSLGMDPSHRINNVNFDLTNLVNNFAPTFSPSTVTNGGVYQKGTI